MAANNAKRRHIVFGSAILALIAAVWLTDSLFSDGGGASVSLTGDISQEARSVSDFDRVHLRGAFRVTLDAGLDYSLSLEGDSALLGITESRVEDGKLMISMEKGTTVSRDDSVNVIVTLPALTGFTGDGAITATLAGIDSPDLDITLNGAGSAVVVGRCGRLSAVSNGAGSVMAKGLHCSEASLTINGAGNMTGYAQDKVSVAVNGMGNVSVYGNPEDVNIAKSGMGSVKIHEDGSEDESEDESEDD